MPEPTLDERFSELRRSVDCELARARRELIAELARAVSQMSAATTEAELNASLEESSAAFDGLAPAREFLATVAEVISHHVRKSPPPGAAADLRAQRFARVKIAEIQLYQSAAVKAGRDARDLYGLLQPQIDAAREAFRERFLIPGQEIDDYLHVELVRELANNDEAVLGPGYPGPMA